MTQEEFLNKFSLFLVYNKNFKPESARQYLYTARKIISRFGMNILRKEVNPEDLLEERRERRVFELLKEFYENSREVLKNETQKPRFTFVILRNGKILAFASVVIREGVLSGMLKGIFTEDSVKEVKKEYLVQIPMQEVILILKNATYKDLQEIVKKQIFRRD